MIRIELLIAPEDRDPAIAALRPLIGAQDRLIELTVDVHPGSLDGQTLRERVTGKVDRHMLVLQIGDDRGDAVIAALEDIHLQQPIRWTRQPIADQGEIGR